MTWLRHNTMCGWFYYRQILHTRAARASLELSLSQTDTETYTSLHGKDPYAHFWHTRG